tara:strand:- start:621 stop:1037 length:417 start_codon:yes stop_codon:yes gene_type:complete
MCKVCGKHWIVDKPHICDFCKKEPSHIDGSEVSSSSARLRNFTDRINPLNKYYVIIVGIILFWSSISSGKSISVSLLYAALYAPIISILIFVVSLLYTSIFQDGFELARKATLKRGYPKLVANIVGIAAGVILVIIFG